MSILLLTLISLSLFFILRANIGALIQLQRSLYRVISRLGYDPLNLGLGTLWEGYKNIQDKRYLEASEERFLSLGNTHRTKMMGVNAISTVDPDNIRTILSSKSNQYGVGTRRQNAFIPYLGHGIISSDGDTWVKSRRLIRSSIILHQTDLTLMEKHVSRLLDSLPRNCSTVDLQPLFFHLTIDIASEFFFGESTHCLAPQKIWTESAEFSNAFARFQCAIRDRMCLGKFATLVVTSKFDKNKDYVYKFVDDFIQRISARRCLSSADIPQQGKSERSELLLDKIFQQSRTFTRLREDILHLFLGARDTTGSLLSNLWFVLARRADIREKLLCEIDAVRGEQLSVKRLKGLKYLNSCIKESLRLHPPIPFNGRTSVCDTVLPHGGGVDGQSPMFVAAGTIVDYNAYALHRRIDLFGPDAREFRPERWNTLHTTWEYLPFSGGPRTCLGQELALVEVAYTTVRIMQEFRVIGSRNFKPWQELLTLTCSSTDGVKVSLSPY